MRSTGRPRRPSRSSGEAGSSGVRSADRRRAALPAAERAAADLLAALGAELDAEHLRETPRRLAQAYAELLTRPFHPTIFPNDERYDELVVAEDIPFQSLCAPSAPLPRQGPPSLAAPATVAALRLRVSTAELQLAETFAIARGSRETAAVVRAVVEHGGVVGRGEGSPVDYWGETPESARAFLEAEGAGALGDDPFALEAIGERLAEHPGEQAAKCALDGALHDWIGRRLSRATWRLLGLRRDARPTSYTIGVDTLEGTVDRVRRAVRFRALKVKLGGASDLERLEAVREETDLPIRVDCNEGWTLERARELIPLLVELGVELVEQPLPAGDEEGYRALREIEPRPPVYLDEGCRDLRSVAPIAGYADGINVKLSKAGGIREALRMIHAARALGLGVMLGCMVESELGVAGAAQLASLADFVDLDGHLLLAASPFRGLELSEGRVLPSFEPGLGVDPAA